MLENEDIIGTEPAQQDAVFEEEPFENIKDSDNLVLALSEEKVKEIGNQVVENTKRDLGSRSEWEKRRGNWHKLFSLTRDPKNFPWEKCSNVGIPTLAIAAIQFQARAFEALFGLIEVVGGKLKDSGSKDKALRVARYMNYQLLDGMEEWEEDMDSMLMQLPLNGSCFKKTYYEKVAKRPVSRYISADDFIVPYGARTLEDAVRKTHVLRMTKSEINSRIAAEEFVSVGELGEPTTETLSSDIERARTESTGVTAPYNELNKPRLVLEHHCQLDMDGDGIDEAYIVTVDYDTSRVFRIEPRQYKDSAQKIRVMEYFTHYVFIPNPDGLYGFGFGHLLEGANEAINALVNQLIDAGTLSNLKGGFFSRRSGLKAGDLKFSMGEYKGVDVPVDDIRKALFSIDFSPPSQVLFSLLSLLQDYSNRVTSVSDTMMGEMPPSDTAATTILAVLEQGLKVFSTIQKRIHRSMKRELKKLFIVDSIYLDEEEYRAVQNYDSIEAQAIPEDWSPKSDFASAIDVIPVSDPNIVSRAEMLIRAEQAYKFGMANPIVANDPDAVYALTIEYYRALGIEDVTAIIKKPEPQVPPDLNPHDENAGFIREVGANVLPQQNHAEHLYVHSIFQDSSWFEKLSPQGKELLDKHMRDTMAAMYLKQNEEGILADKRGRTEGVGTAGGYEGSPTGAGVVPPEYSA